LEEKSGQLATLIFVPGKHETPEDAVGQFLKLFGGKIRTTGNSDFCTWQT
jgi:hypothetical protein